MEEQKLPNATTSLVLGIVSFLCCFFSSGIGGIILSGIALYLSNRDLKLYAEDPESYNNYKQVKTARIIAIIGLVLAVVTLISVIIFIMSKGGWNAYMEEVRRMVERY